MKLIAGNLLEPASDSIALNIDDDIIFFHRRRIVAVRKGDVVYRPTNLTGGIVFRRIKEAVMKNGVAVLEVAIPELYRIAEEVVIKAASKAIDERLTSNEGDDHG